MRNTNTTYDMVIILNVWCKRKKTQHLFAQTGNATRLLLVLGGNANTL
jgi:hypothetical protein